MCNDAKDFDIKILSLIGFCAANQAPISEKNRPYLIEARRSIDRMLTEMSGVSVLPSAHQVGDPVEHWPSETVTTGTYAVAAVKFTDHGKVYYDLKRDGLYRGRVDSAHVKTPLGEKDEVDQSSE